MPPAERRAGRVRIAVIDSGVHPGHPHILADRLLPGVAFRAANQVESGPSATVDRIGHGTAVAAAIQEKAPDADLIPVRVFHDALKTSAGTLAAAIAWAVGQGADIVNLSLGTTNPAHRGRFAAVVAEAAADDVLIVAPYRVADTLCLPGSLDGVVGVDVDWNCPRDSYRIAHDVAFASGHPRQIEGVSPNRNIHGVSFAAAQMSGFAAQILATIWANGQDGGTLRDTLMRGRSQVSLSTDRL